MTIISSILSYNKPNVTRHLCCVQLLIIVIVSFSGMIYECDAQWRKGKPPLHDDESQTRKPIKPSQTHCAFGNQSYELEQRWRPNLPPNGVYYCIRCECIAVQRKSRMIAKVRCKNFKNDCPEPTCDNPVLLPERCCKTCPGFDYANLEEDLGISKLERHHQHHQTSDEVHPDLNGILPNIKHKCYYEGKIYEDGSQWKAENDCEMCSCQRGRIKCEPEACPKLHCPNRTTVPGSCCRICSDDVDTLNATKNSGCFFEGDKQAHVFGSSWHPYLPPFGFDKCSLCTCYEGGEIKCERNTDCPPLTCSEQEAYRENPMDCCKRCPNVLPVKSIITMDHLGDQRSSNGLVKGPNELLEAGGCRFKGRVFSNGDEWHPTVQPFGEVKCVKCHCKDGIHRCKRIICPKITACSIVINKNNECCPICADESEDFMMKNQAQIQMPKRGGRRRKGRRRKGRKLHQPPANVENN